MAEKTDSEIEQWVLRELRLSEKICSSEISVLARDGVVRLQGSAHSHQDRLAIEEATRGATGVVGVVNEMKVNPKAALIQHRPTAVPLVMRTPGGLLHPLTAHQQGQSHTRKSAS